MREMRHKHVHVLIHCNRRYSTPSAVHLHKHTRINQAEESLKQREAARGLEERWQQQMAREAADARKEMKALGEAVEEDIGANVATMRWAQWGWLVMTFLHVFCFPRVYVYHFLFPMCRKERLELRAELLVALQDLDGRLATSWEELSRQGPCVHVHR